MNSKRKSLKMNALLSMINSILTMGFSLLTYPYVARVLQADNLGKVNYANSIVSYFSLIALLGFSTYAIREGSRLRENSEKANIFCNEIFTLNFGTVLVAYILLIVTVITVSKLQPFVGLILLQSISIFSAWISSDWVNAIYEDYFSITIRSIAIRLISLIFLFLLVKNTNDYYIYAAILVCSTLIADFINFIYIRKYVKVKLVRGTNIQKHLPPVLVFFSNSIAVNIYLNSDITMLGWICGSTAVGYYSAAVRIYSAIKSIIAAVYNTAVPRMSLYANYENKAEFKNLFNKIVNAIIFITLPATIMLFCTSEEIVYIIAGKAFYLASKPLKVLALAFLFAVLGGALAYCVCVPLKMEKNVLYATVIAAIENIGLNIVFIPLYGITGTAITTLLAEITVFTVLCFSIMKKKVMLKFNDIIKNSLKSLVGTIIIGFSKCLVNKIIYEHWIIKLFSFYVLAFAVYLGIERLLKNSCCEEAWRILLSKRYKAKDER